MILVDSCVIFDFTRRIDPHLAGHFKVLPVGMCGIIRAEVLHGARSASERVSLVEFLDRFAQIPTPETIWDTVGDNLAILRRAGITVPLPDAVLCSIAIVGGHELCSRDAHFSAMKRILPALQLFAEP